MPPAGSRNAPEARAREKIDALLVEAGWAVQDRDEMNLSLPAVAVREFPLARGHGFADYLLFFDRKTGAHEAWMKKLWIYDLRTNKEFTLKQRRMERADLDEFVECYNPDNRNDRKPTWDEKKNPEGRWRMFDYKDLVARDKCSLDIFWLKDESLEDSANLPDSHILAAEIAEDLRAALEQIGSVLGDLQARVEVVE